MTSDTKGQTMDEPRPFSPAIRRTEQVTVTRVVRVKVELSEILAALGIPESASMVAFTPGSPCVNECANTMHANTELLFDWSENVTEPKS